MVEEIEKTLRKDYKYLSNKLRTIKDDYYKFTLYKGMQEYIISFLSRLWGMTLLETITKIEQTNEIERKIKAGKKEKYINERLY